METTSGENSEININLKVISQINEGDKLFVSQNLLQIDRSQRGIANASVRWYNNESRQQTMIQLNKIIRKAFEYMKNDKLITQNLDQSIKGLIELKKTYTDDPTIVAQIDVLMEEIKEKREMNFKSFNSVNSNIEDNIEDNIDKNLTENLNNNSKSKKNK